TNRAAESLQVACGAQHDRGLHAFAAAGLGDDARDLAAASGTREVEVNTPTEASSHLCHESSLPEHAPLAASECDLKACFPIGRRPTIGARQRRSADGC